jgi:hypothetical protein
VKRRKKKKPQIAQIVTDLRERFFSKDVFVVAWLLLLAFILRLVYLSHLKARESWLRFMKNIHEIKDIGWR